MYAPSQWEATLQCNGVSHWLGANTKWSLEQSRLETMTHTWCHRYDSAHTAFAMRKGFSWTFIVMMILEIAYLRIVDLGSMPVITGSGRYEKVKPVVMLRSPMLTVMMESKSSVVRSGVRHRITVSLLENRKGLVTYRLWTIGYQAPISGYRNSRDLVSYWIPGDMSTHWGRLTHICASKLSHH